MAGAFSIGGGERHEVSLAQGHLPDERRLVVAGRLQDVVVRPCANGAEIVAGGMVNQVWIGRRGDRVFVHAFGRAWDVASVDEAARAADGGLASHAAVAPMPGSVVSVHAAEGEQVTAGQVVVVLESMKMHSDITVPRDGVVARVLVAAGDSVQGDAPLVTLEVQSQSQPGSEED